MNASWNWPTKEGWTQTMAVYDVTNVLFANLEQVHFPFDKPFQVKDQFNGPTMGTWYLHSWDHQALYGPFDTEKEAALWLSEIKEVEQ